MMDPSTTRRARRQLAVRCRAVTEDPAFAILVFALILFNAALQGAETYQGLAAQYREALHAAEVCCLVLFTGEIALRLGAHADRPKAFFRDPWNVFDLLVVTAAFLPSVQENTTLLRILRLARVLRSARFLPQLRVLLLAVGRSLPGTVSFLFVGALVVYVYAMVGWLCFAESDPQHYGSVGRAALTLFLLTTLDGFGDAVHAGLAISRFTLLYYASYVLLASFVLVNVLIGVVLTSLDEARETEKEAEAQRRLTEGGDPLLEVRRRIAAAREALDEVEAGLRGVGDAPTPAAARPLETARRS
ncbi:ion transporter [Streptomyces bambusae]|uniref:ion transporter n=1 Tax=Streptomyces bambusae TaxID=1550616 RepID=UPI001CFC514A|nr:ion transporter [Streptomyces bambusae]MCB5164233.1 ion transporter [Streptomyces bambusae]